METPPDTSSPIRRAAWALLGVAGIVALHVLWRRIGGHEELLQHEPMADARLDRGEIWLYAASVLIGAPAAWCVARALRGVELSRVVAAASSRRGLVLAALVASSCALAIAHFVTDYAWFTDDEQAYLFQAQLYARGELTTPVLQPKALFRHLFVVEVAPRDGVRQWTGAYPVLQPALLAIAKGIAFAHLSQVVCVGVLTYNAGRLAQRWFASASAGAYVAWLCATSPLLCGLGATLHTAILAATLTVLAARLLLWTCEHVGVGRGAALGICAGAIVLTRPLEGALVVAVSAGVLVWACAKRARVTALLGYALGGLAPLAVLLAVNYRLTGRAHLGAYAVLEREIGRFIGFGEGMLWGREHTPTLGLEQTLTALARVNAFAFGWPLSLALVAACCTRPFRDRRIALLLGVSALHLALYFFLAFGAVHDFGHAYHVWHVPWIALASAWVLQRSPRARSVALGMSCVALGFFWPVQIARWRAVSEVVWTPIRAVESAVGSHPAIVLWTSMQPPGAERSWVFRPPAPLPDAQILWAYDDASGYEQLARRFGDRAFWRLRWRDGEPLVEPVEL